MEVSGIGEKIFADIATAHHRPASKENIMRIYPVKRPLCAAIVAFIAGLWLSSAQALPWMDAFFVCSLLAFSVSPRNARGCFSSVCSRWPADFY